MWTESSRPRKPVRWSRCTTACRKRPGATPRPAPELVRPGLSSDERDEGARRALPNLERSICPPRGDDEDLTVRRGTDRCHDPTVRAELERPGVRDARRSRRG